MKLKTLRHVLVNCLTTLDSLILSSQFSRLVSHFDNHKIFTLILTDRWISTSTQFYGFSGKTHIVSVSSFRSHLRKHNKRNVNVEMFFYPKPIAIVKLTWVSCFSCFSYFRKPYRPHPGTSPSLFCNLRVANGDLPEIWIVKSSIKTGNLRFWRKHGL